MGFKLRLFFIALILALVTMALLPFQIIIVRLFPHHSHHLSKIWNKIVLKLIGFSINIIGTPVSGEPTLWLANHVSWSDIPVLGAILPGYFVAKKDMSDWPILGFLARVQNTIFVDREHRSTTIAQANAIAQKLQNNHSVILFPEGTTTDGMSLYPFKSALLGGVNMALNHEKTLPKTFKVQPVTLCYNKLYGMPLGRFELHHVAWPGSIELMPHLLNVIKQGAFQIDVIFAPPIEYDQNSDRKTITKQIKATIQHDLTKGLRG